MDTSHNTRHITHAIRMSGLIYKHISYFTSGPKNFPEEVAEVGN